MKERLQTAQVIDCAAPLWLPDRTGRLSGHSPEAAIVSFPSTKAIQLSFCNRLSWNHAAPLSKPKPTGISVRGH